MSELDKKQASNEFPDCLNTSSSPSFEKGEASSTTQTERVREHLQGEVHNNYVDVVIILCWFVTGLLDGTIFNGMIYDLHLELGNDSELRLISSYSISYLRIDADW